MLVSARAPGRWCPSACPGALGRLPRRVRASLAAARRRHRPAGLQPRSLGSKPDDEVEPVPPAMLAPLASEADLAAEADWVAAIHQCWLNEEWAAAELLEVHASLAAATGQAYRRVRQQAGMDEMGDLVLALAGELLAFDFGPTFTSAFDVSNKVVELLMLRGGCDVCCTNESDRTAIARFEAQLAAGRPPP